MKEVEMQTNNYDPTRDVQEWKCVELGDSMQEGVINLDWSAKRGKAKGEKHKKAPNRQ